MPHQACAHTKARGCWHREGPFGQRQQTVWGGTAGFPEPGPGTGLPVTRAGQDPVQTGRMGGQSLWALGARCLLVVSFSR